MNNQIKLFLWAEPGGEFVSFPLQLTRIVAECFIELDSLNLQLYLFNREDNETNKKRLKNSYLNITFSFPKPCYL